MKKLLSVIVCAAVLLSLCVTCLAEGFAVKLTPSAETVAPGSTFTVKISLSGAPQGTSGSLAVEVSDGLTVKSGKMLRADAMLSAFDNSKNKGVISFGKTADFSGEYAEITVAVNAEASGTQKITAAVSVTPGSSSAAGELSVKVSGDQASEGDTSSDEGDGSSKGIAISLELLNLL